MKLSVIVPVYNVKPYLEKCLDSVLGSIDGLEFRDKAEVICIDDGSTDGSSDVLREFGRKDVRIKIVRQENRGLSAARNAGLDIARGEWIAFVDSDDWVDAGYFSALFAAIDRTGCPVSAIDTRDAPAARYWCKRGFPPTVAWGKVFKASLWKGRRFPVGRLHEDEFVVHEAVFAGGDVAGVRKRFYHYVARDDSIMHRQDRKGLQDWLEGCSAQAAYLKERDNLAYAVALGKKIQVEHWLGAVDGDDVREYGSAMGWRIGNYYWPEHYRHPWLINRLTWKLIRVLGV